MAEKTNKIRLQGHEKFFLRDGWLNKGITIIEDNPKVFLGKDGPDVFGIGSNMVKSLRYWLKAFGIIEEKAGVGAYLTEIGKKIKKYDKYFEDDFTLWVLHSNIAKNVSEATTWYMFFNMCDIEEFTKEEIEFYIGREITKYVMGESYSQNSLKNDVDMLLNMYSKEKGKVDPEEKNVSPMVSLQLIKKSNSGYVKSQPDRRMISEWSVLFELAHLLTGRESISIDDASTGKGSISAIYHLSRVTINEMFDKLDALGYIKVDRTAGLDMIYKVKDISPEDVVEEYYSRRVR